ncbi:Glycosyltransferase [Sulfitobacter noctilucicola]|uniref:Glycosyltransferase involved in cell wall biosynthesis n=1 Tax=Sulfitobacter noctilucicola TaxID=1342301 RepID=A0A7W6M8E0_9RHOB|nr:glycosyltransferase family A protein [Sulfitobacter noctilucicola]KIN64483.1 Glycosyltransferase [Sulfitobacter noctilucicola]MBB4174358.1 glycosyltransferase involved in cell wall biosynthesis [Sulfitobacter noctilucicola]
MTDFSIIIPCYNAAQTIRATLDSIQAQTCDNWEVICIDDGSTDNTLGLLHDLRAEDPRIHVFQNMGKGPSCARNLGALFFAGSEIIAFCDADDIWGPNKLSELKTCFADPSVDAAFCKIAFFHDDPSIVSAVSSIPATPLSIPMLLGENPVCTMSNIAVRHDAFLRTGGFDETMVHNEDLDWLIRLVGTGSRVIGIDSCQTWYRTSPYGLSANLQAMLEGRTAAIRTAARYGHAPDRSADAIFLRYLSRRALRLGQGRLLPLSFALQGVARSPSGFFSVPRRGFATLAGACLAPILPSRISEILFSR